MSCYKRIGMVVLTAVMLGTGRSAHTEPITITPIANIRWRQEVQDTLNPAANKTNHYSFGSARGRFGADTTWKSLTLHGFGQAAISYNVPNDAPFGPGSAYFSNSGNESSPRHLRVAELSLIYKQGFVTATVGRQGLMDGAETMSGLTRFDTIKRERLSERLIGNWDWPNVGRRYDGASASYNHNRWAVSAFGARVLQGGFDYDDAFDSRDGTAVGGISYTFKRDAWIPQSEIRTFYIQYRDSATSTISALGKRLWIHTVGVNWLGVYPVGPGAFDVLLWDAYQFGDYGNQHQSANAFLVEAGYGWQDATWSPWIRAGINRASGDGDASDNTHGTFFNLAPTNHKFYGYQDLNAFQNLTDLFAELRVEPTKKLKLQLTQHLFRISDVSDGWYNGSGVINNTSLGYTRRFPAGSTTISRTIGTETDLSTTWTPHKRVAFHAGVSRFVGGAAVKKLFPVQSIFNLFYFQTTIQY